MYNFLSNICYQFCFMLLQTYIQQQLQKLQGHRHHHHDTEAMAESGSDDDDEDLTRDEFNLNKLIVLVTGAGKVSEFNRQ